MKELTDLEICIRIAEIEGYEFLVNDSIINGNVDIRVFPTIHLHDSFIFNPLTDDALCFKLIREYFVDVWYSIPTPDVGGWSAKTYDGDEVFNLNLNKAICLAIIKAHE